ncbi:MAG: hypothetical protein K6A44_00855 [bacterium]|nr:hypothetical protein [bacterium]
MKIQKISNQSFGVAILSDKIQNTMDRERATIGHFWGVFSPQYDYLYQMQQQIDDLHADGVLGLREKKDSFSLLLLRRNDFSPVTKTYTKKKLSTKLILDFLKSFESAAKWR